MSDNSEMEIGWYSCDPCSTRRSEETCPSTGCVWVVGDSVSDGVCISNEDYINTITCEMLSKSVCDRYIDSNTYINGIIVDNAPCFFNNDDTLGLFCISQSLLKSNNNCSLIKTNKIIIHDNIEKETCNNGQEIFGLDVTCEWFSFSRLYGDDSGICSSVYFLSNGIYIYLYIFFYFVRI